MNAFLWALGSGMVLFAGVISYAMTRRYGWGAALAMPVVALVAMLGMQWQALGLEFRAGLQELLPYALFSLPILLGSVAGIAVARLRRG
ncbi:MAG TPA: hypothetical protein VK146_13175 [Tabrizicola sp.]|nr:hypothetical protein [Tabrizicola sp.]